MIAGRVVGERRASPAPMSALGKSRHVRRKRHVRFTPESGHVQRN